MPARKTKKVTWSEYDTEYLWLAAVRAKLDNHNLSNVAVAEKLGRTRLSIQGRIAYLKDRRWVKNIWPKTYDYKGLQATIRHEARISHDELIVDIALKKIKEQK